MSTELTQYSSIPAGVDDFAQVPPSVGAGGRGAASCAAALCTIADHCPKFASSRAMATAMINAQGIAITHRDRPTMGPPIMPSLPYEINAIFSGIIPCQAFIASWRGTPVERHRRTSASIMPPGRDKYGKVTG